MAPKCRGIFPSTVLKRTYAIAKGSHTKPYRKKFEGTGNRLWEFLKLATCFSINKFYLLLIILNSLDVTIATVNNNNFNINNFNDSKQIQLHLREIFKSNALNNNNINISKSSIIVDNDNINNHVIDESQFLKVIKLINFNDDSAQIANSSQSFDVDTGTRASNTRSKWEAERGRREDGSEESVGNVEETRTFRKYEGRSSYKVENDTLVSRFQKTRRKKRRRRRKKRYVRFPPGDGGRFSGKFHRGPFQSSPPVVGGSYHGGFLPWNPIVRPSSYHSHGPTMRPRSPRLVFRDPVEPGTLSAPSNFFGSGLQDIGFEDDREERGGKGMYTGAEDHHGLCPNGKCEFFLSCWMTSGMIDGSCGGFLYACCQRLDKEAPKTNEHHTNDAITLPTNFGPVVNDFRCGVSIGKLGAQRRIVGGDEAGFGSFPWQAYIRIGSSRCGGSLVNRFHVVTAGHCVARASARQVQVTLGDYVINSAVEPLPAYTFGVREIRVHPYFKFTPQADRFDVAVLRLDRPVQYMPHIAPICLPEKNEDFLGQYGWAAGWGALQAGSRLRPKTLQAVDVPVIDNRLCERWHKSNGINVVIYDEMMCAGYRNGGKDSCQGDSGGPLMMEKANRWYLIGIVSAGYSCAQRGQPGIYHRVAHTVDWISYIINS